MLEIKSLDHSFNGIAKLNNKVVFVKNALPGEIVEIKIINEKKKYIKAVVDKFIKTSEERIESKCKYFDFCGGCDLLHLDYNNQLKYKQEKIINIFNKYFNEKVKINSIVFDKQFYYRNKIKFQVNNKIGFYKNNSYEVIPVDKCLIADKKINNSIDYLNKLDLKYISSITCRVHNNKLMIDIDSSKDIDITPIIDISNSIYVNNKLIYGEEKLTDDLGNYKFVISSKSFFQVNKNVCLKLYSKIKEYVGKNKKILDLYCGCGTIGIYVNETNTILGIEINKFAIDDALENKKINELNNIDFICGDSSIEANFKPEIIIVDPPRSGLNNKTIDKVIALNPKKIIYVSCNPMTLVRDLNYLNIYTVVEITPYDMFPNTKHVECVCVLKLR